MFWIGAPLAARRLAVPQLAERPQRHPVDQAVREDVGDGQQLRRLELQRVARSFAGSWSRVASEPRVSTARPSFAPVAWCRSRRPSSRTCRRAVGEQREQLVEVAGAVGVDDEVRRLRAVQPDRRRDDHAGQPHAADGGPEQLGLGAVRGQRADRAVGGDQVHRQHVVAEAAVAVVVLAVDVGGDRAADRHLPGARQHRHPPAERQRGPHERVQADAGVDDRDARVGVDRGRAGEPGHVEHDAAGVLRRVAVGAAEAAGDHAARAGAPDRGDDVGGRAGGGDVREVGAVRPQPCRLAVEVGVLDIASQATRPPPARPARPGKRCAGPRRPGSSAPRLSGPVVMIRASGA